MKRVLVAALFGPAVTGLVACATQPARRSRTLRRPTVSVSEPARPGQITRSGSAANSAGTAWRPACGGAAVAGGPSTTTQGGATASATRQPVLASRQISPPDPWAGFPLSVWLELPPLDDRRAVARTVPGTGLLLHRSGGNRPAGAATRLRLGALRPRPPGGQPYHGSSRGRGVWRALLAPNVASGLEQSCRHVLGGARSRGYPSLREDPRHPLRRASYRRARVRRFLAAPCPLSSPRVPAQRRCRLTASASTVCGEAWPLPTTVATS